MDVIRAPVRWSLNGRDAGIVCRRCEAVFPVAEGSCPDCGTPVRGLLAPTIAVGTGLVVLLPSLSPFDVLPALLGLGLLWLGVHVVRDRRERIREATERRGQGRPGPRNTGQR